ncbi:MAG: hemerythrin domain-containing protein [Anaerovoracaceae bacterium]|nr:hemerythrin domain-containing protein [Anaerovoracaceae bacterium]
MTDKEIMSSIEIMEDDHAVINRMLLVIRDMCCGILEGAEIVPEDHRQIIDFCRKFADEHHHAKEEKFLFPEMVSRLGRIAENLVTHGMLVEHDRGRAHVLAWETALAEYEKDPKTEHKLDVITEAMGYAHQMQMHTEKEDNVVYPFALRSLPIEVIEDIDRRTLEFEEKQKADGIKEKYLDILKTMENKYLTSAQEEFSRL